MKLGESWHTDPRFEQWFHRFHLVVELACLRRSSGFSGRTSTAGAALRRCESVFAKSTARTLRTHSDQYLAIRNHLQRKVRRSNGNEGKRRQRRANRAEKSSAGSKAAAHKVEPAKGKLGVMVVGLGAVATTMIAGVEAVRRGLAKPIGSLTQMGTIRLGKRTDNNSPLIKDFVPLADLNDIVFTGWDIFEDNVYEAAAHAAVLEQGDARTSSSPISKPSSPCPRSSTSYYVKRLNGTHVKKGKNKRDLAEQVIADIRAFKKTVDRVVMIWCGSTEIFIEPTAVHQIDRGLRERAWKRTTSASRPRRSTPTRRSRRACPSPMARRI